MQLGEVVGQGVSTVKHPSMTGSKLLVVQLVNDDGKADGEPLLAIDFLGAGIGDRVVMSSDGAGARQIVGHSNSPVRWMVMGICDYANR